MKMIGAAKAKLTTGQIRVADIAQQCNGCYLRHWNAQEAFSDCHYCFTGKIMLPDTLLLPPVWTGLNSLSVFSAIQKLPVELLAGSMLKIDFSEVNYLDSSGLGALVGLQKQLRRQGTIIHIIGADAHVLRLLRTANLDRIFKIN